MTRRPAATLHIEWSREGVAAYDTATGQSASARVLMELGGILSGHREAVVGLSRGEVFLKAVRLPRADFEDLRRIVTVQLAQLFPLAPDQLAFDCVQTAAQDGLGAWTVIAAARVDDLKQLRSELKEAGLAPVRILPIALGAWAMALRTGLASAMVVERTATGLALDVVADGALRLSRLVPERSDPPTEIGRTLAAAGLERLPLLASEGLQLADARRAAGSALAFLAEAPAFRFELQEDRDRAAGRRAAARIRSAGAFLAGAIIVSGIFWSDRAGRMTVARKGEARWNTDLTALRSQRDIERARARKLADIQTVLSRAFEPAQPLSDVTAFVGDRLPASAWLTGLNVERGKAVQIRGTAMDAADVACFVSTLSSTPRFRDVRLVFANSARIEEKTVVQFNVAATAVGNLPMPAPEKRVSKTRTKSGSKSGLAADRTEAS